MTAPDWIAVDWGTSRLRAWAMSSGSDVLEHFSSSRGMSTLTPPDYEQALLEMIEPWMSGSKKLTVLACGMLGSQQGWVDVPYRSVPCNPLPELTPAPVSSNRIEVLICSGLKQEEPADVMRGEETQIAGLLATDPEFEGTVCLPGTHSKWVRIGNGGVVEAFQTFMTGELFDLLADRWVLRHSLAGGDDWNDLAFDEAVMSAVADPVSVSSMLFSLRAESLLHEWNGSVARSRLSGWLIGQELAAARDWWMQGRRNVVIIGARSLSALYDRALRSLGVESQLKEIESMTLAGLHSAVRNRLHV